MILVEKLKQIPIKLVSRELDVTKTSGREHIRFRERKVYRKDFEKKMQ